jgi:hypothetical protein
MKGGGKEWEKIRKEEGRKTTIKGSKKKEKGRKRRKEEGRRIGRIKVRRKKW